MSVTNVAVLTGLQFPLTGAVTKMLTGGRDRRLTGAEAIAAGFVGGFVSGLACAPMELVMIQQQKFGGSALATPVRIVQQQGLVGGLMRGLTTACGREGLFTAGYLGLAPTVAMLLQEQYGVAPTQASILGAIPAGLVAATLSHPLDTIKTCMQGDLERKSYGTFRQTAAVLYGCLCVNAEWN
jgi:solute carrier family 25 carnitine/acylcarnitine transporter 20/29